MNAEGKHFLLSCSNQCHINTYLNTCWDYVNAKNESSLNLSILDLRWSLIART